MSVVNGGHRVVVTGLGVVTPIGQYVPDFWAALQRGQCGVSEVTGIPEDDLKIKIAAQVKDFDPRARLRHFKRDKLMSSRGSFMCFLRMSIILEATSSILLSRPARPVPDWAPSNAAQVFSPSAILRQACASHNRKR